MLAWASSNLASRASAIAVAVYAYETDGIAAVVDKLKGHPLFAHVTLVRSERSPIAALVTEMLEDSGL